MAGEIEYKNNRYKDKTRKENAWMMIYFGNRYRFCDRTADDATYTSFQ
jgi:hypothetical protein